MTQQQFSGSKGAIVTKLRAQLSIAGAILLTATFTQLHLRAIAAETSANSARNASWKSIYTADELTTLPALIEEKKKPLQGRLRTAQKNDGARGVSSYAINLDRQIAHQSASVSKAFEIVRLENKPMQKKFLAWDKKRLLLNDGAQLEALLAVRASIASESQVVTGLSGATIKQQSSSAPSKMSGASTICADSKATGPANRSTPSFLGVTVGMTEAQAIQAACQSNNGDVKVLSRSTFYTHRAAKSYLPTNEFTRGDYTRASNAIGKEYHSSTSLCVGCSDRVQGAQADILRQPSELELSILPNGKIYRISTLAPRGSNFQKPPYPSALTALQNGFGNPTFKAHTYEWAVVAWRYPNYSAPLESWFFTQNTNRTVVTHYREEGALFPKGYYSEPVLRKANPQTSFCLHAYGFDNSAVNGWSRYFVFEGPRADVMTKVERKSVEEIAREQASWVAPGFTKNCGKLVYATIGFPQAEYQRNSDLKSTKDYGRDIPSGNISLTMLDTAQLDEWKSAERREVEAHIRSTKSR